jgi:hypothetical protein
MCVGHSVVEHLVNGEHVPSQLIQHKQGNPKLNIVQGLDSNNLVDYIARVPYRAIEHEKPILTAVIVC